MPVSRKKSSPEITSTISLIFFFQAEDGIRDTSVTGVQTCALPICALTALAAPLVVLAILSAIVTNEIKGRLGALMMAFYLLNTLVAMVIGLTLTKDRKSTRLNSSHRCISYAVFCLKKKNNYNNIRH